LIPEHHVVVYPRQAVGVVPRDEAGNFLLIDHYRFITDSRGWEIPAGQIEETESVAEAAARELLEETGHRSTQWRALGHYFPSNGSSNQVFHVLLARALQKVTAVVDANETLNCRWFSEREVRTMLANNGIRDGFSLTALMWALMV
jgi:8-oxo-dGTP pyrophosphatase MutT (NUDIX family)